MLQEYKKHDISGPMLNISLIMPQIISHVQLSTAIQTKSNL